MGECLSPSFSSGGGKGGQSLVIIAINPLGPLRDDKQPVPVTYLRDLDRADHRYRCVYKLKGRRGDCKTMKSFTGHECALTLYNTAAQMKNNDSHYRG